MGKVVDLVKFRRNKHRQALTMDFGGDDEQTLKSLERRLKEINDSIAYGRTVQEREQLAISTLEISEKIAVLKRKLTGK